MTSRGITLFSVALAVLLVFGGGALIVRHDRSQGLATTVATVGDLVAVHPDVSAGGQLVEGERRLSLGDAVQTGKEGRARARLDDGTLVAMDAGTRLKLGQDRLELEAGRIFVQAGVAASTRIQMGEAVVTVQSSSAAFERRDKRPSQVYCAQGELSVLTQGKPVRVGSGDTAHWGPDGVVVAPEKAFDDWTGGLATPWAGELGDRSTIPVVRGRTGGDDPGTPLVIRAQRIEVEIDGEVARTRTRTTYFNGSASVARASLYFALPPGAILNRVARRSGSSSPEDQAELAIASRGGPSGGGGVARIEWAGGGYLRGELGPVPAGETIELSLDYSEWLSARGDRGVYRFLMAGGSDPPLIGELSAVVDATRTGTPFLTASAGASVDQRVVELRRADFRPTGDLVVELAPRVVHPKAARAYVVPGPPGQDPYVMVRTELGERVGSGVTLALVVDASASVGPALETARAVVDSVLEGLGPRDSVLVLAADQSVRPLGSSVPEPVTPALRDRLRRELSLLRAGGASNLGHALERAADILDAPGRSEGQGMVVYIGDGRPSVGATDAEGIRKLLGRRRGGIPRLSAVATGGLSDRWLLARLVAGMGSVHEVPDRADAARAGAALLADALKPTLRDVELDLGPSIDRVYPRESRAVVTGSTVTQVGRLRGGLPTRIAVRYRVGSELTGGTRLLYRTSLPRGADVPRRWMEARIEEMAARGDGIDPVIAAAAEAKLLTPWTSFFFGSPSAPRNSPPVAERLLELSPDLDAAYARRIEEPALAGPTLLEPADRIEGDSTLREAAEAAVRRVLERARNAVRACRDARAGVRPELSSEISLEVSVNADGKATRVRVVIGRGRERDPVLERCIEGVVRSLPYLTGGLAVSVAHSLWLPEGRGSQRTACSAASKVSLPLKRMIWQERELGFEAYRAALRTCELPRWADRKAFLLLLLERTGDGGARLAVARELEIEGEPDAAAFIRRETLRRVETFEELRELSQIVRQDEPAIDTELDRAYRAAANDEARLRVVRRFLGLAPHNVLARRRLLSVLERLGEKEELWGTINEIRAEPFVDAGLLAQGASSLRRIGREAESERAFGELIERAPRDPWTLAFVGDRLRAEGLFDAAGAAYESLFRALPNDASAALRMALAHAGAGRLDLAARLLERVTQSGGVGDDGRLGELATMVQAVLLAGALGDSDPGVRAELERRLLRAPLPDAASVVLVRAPPSDDPLRVRLGTDRDAGETRPAELDAPALGIAGARVERGTGKVRILLSRQAEPGQTRPTRARIAALILGHEGSLPRLVTREVDVLADGKVVELGFDGEAFL